MAIFILWNRIRKQITNKTNPSNLFSKCLKMRKPTPNLFKWVPFKIDFAISFRNLKILTSNFGGWNPSWMCLQSYNRIGSHPPQQSWDLKTGCLANDSQGSWIYPCLVDLLSSVDPAIEKISPISPHGAGPTPKIPMILPQGGPYQL